MLMIVIFHRCLLPRARSCFGASFLDFSLLLSTPTEFGFSTHHPSCLIAHHPFLDLQNNTRAKRSLQSSPCGVMLLRSRCLCVLSLRADFHRVPSFVFIRSIDACTPMLVFSMHSLQNACFHQLHTQSSRHNIKPCFWKVINCKGQREIFAESYYHIIRSF